MGSEDLFHKRKARNKTSLERAKNKREVYDKILIVCEGTKTEPYYFTDARQYHKLNTLNIKIEGTGNDPLRLVERARDIFSEEDRKGDAFDAVYCVFDKDEHANYQQARDLIANFKPKGSWFAITSVPCFEYWLILHFIYTAQPFYSMSGKSAAKAVEGELKRYIPDYFKGKESLYSDLYPQVARAIHYAKRVLQGNQQLNTDNPSTYIHTLVERIQKIKTKT